MNRVPFRRPRVHAFVACALVVTAWAAVLPVAVFARTPALHAVFDSTATSSIAGHLLAGGGPPGAWVLCGRTAMLRPRGRYADRWWTQWAIGGRLTMDDDPAVYLERRETTVDSTRAFRFEHVPPGDYYVVSALVWRAAGVRQGDGWIEIVGAPVTVRAGAAATADLASLHRERRYLAIHDMEADEDAYLGRLLYPGNPATNSMHE